MTANQLAAALAEGDDEDERTCLPCRVAQSANWYHTPCPRPVLDASGKPVEGPACACPCRFAPAGQGILVIFEE